jgi:hypothetical protein
MGSNINTRWLDHGYMGSITNREEFTYLPISLRYRPYTADSKFVRQESLGGAIWSRVQQTVMRHW